jgi:hypothetical protein
MLTFLKRKEAISYIIVYSVDGFNRLGTHTIYSAINYSSKLNTLCTCEDYHQKQQIQFLVFSNGIRYNRKKDECRTERVNSVFSYIAQLARVVGKVKSGYKEENFSVSAFVENIGLEPITSNMPCLRSTR